MNPVLVIVGGVTLILLAAFEHRARVDEQWMRGFLAGAGVSAFVLGILFL